jgi:hypothetical protein
MAQSLVVIVRQHRTMHDHHSFRQIAIGYWEKRRLWYNLALLPPSLFGYVIMVDEAQKYHPIYVLMWFFLCAIGANICYSLAYAAEFIFGSDDPAPRWLRFGRDTIFVLGLLFSLVLALLGGRNISLMEFHYR